MRSYINKGLIILVLILANILLPMKKEAVKYENKQIKEKFTFASGRDEIKLKKAKKISIAKPDTNFDDTKKNEIINNILTKNIDISNFNYDYHDIEDEFASLDLEQESSEDDEDEKAIVLDSNDNSLLDHWQITDAVVCDASGKNIVLYKKSGNICLKAKDNMLANKDFISVDFSGCTNAKLILKKDDKYQEVDLSNTMNLKYFYLGDKYRASKIVSIEFINDKDKEFYLSIGEINYE